MLPLIELVVGSLIELVVGFESFVGRNFEFGQRNQLLRAPSRVGTRSSKGLESPRYKNEGAGGGERRACLMTPDLGLV